MAKKSGKNTKGKTKTASKKKKGRSVIDFIKDERFKVTVGIILISFAVMLVLSFTSYLFTWQADQSELDVPFGKYFLNPDESVENWIGKIGVLLSNLFIHDWFGLASFGFVLLFILLGFRLMNVRLMPLGRSIFMSLLAMIWFSVALSFFFADNWFFLGGAHGLFITQRLNALLGQIGTLILLVIILLAFILFSFKNALPVLKSWIFRARHFKVKELHEEEKQDIDEGISPETEDADPNLAEDGLSGETETNDVGTTVTIKPEESDTTASDVSENSGKEGDKEEVDLQVAQAEEDETVDESAIEDVPQGDYDPTLDLGLYKVPPVDLLEEHSVGDVEVSEEVLQKHSETILQTLKDYKIDIASISATVGPTVTMYEIVPAPGVRISKIKIWRMILHSPCRHWEFVLLPPFPVREQLVLKFPIRSRKLCPCVL